MQFSGKVAFVTGAASGIGRACALKLAQQGADLFLADINPDLLATIVDEVSALGREVDSQVFDVSSGDSCRAAVDAAVKRFGRLDILCNIAGIAGASHFADISDDYWRRMVGINLDSVFYLSQAAMPHLLQSKGNIVNMASSAGFGGTTWMLSTSGFLTLFGILQLRRPHSTGLLLTVLSHGASALSFRESATNLHRSRNPNRYGAGALRGGNSRGTVRVLHTNRTGDLVAIASVWNSCSVRDSWQ